MHTDTTHPSVFWHSVRLTVALVTILATGGGCGSSKQQASMERQAENLRIELAETYVAKGAFEAAIPLLRRMLKDDPTNLRTRVMYATVLRDMQLHVQAEREFLLALRLAPDYAPAHAGIGITYDLQRSGDKARPHHERAIALNPKIAAFHNNLGFSLYLSGDHAKAITAYETALALDPALTVAYNNLGFAYGRMGQFDKAQRSFRSVGSRPATLINMSIVYDRAGKVEHAQRMRAEAYALAPDLRPDDKEKLR